MSSNEKNLEISFEQDMPAIAAAGENYVIPMPAISRRAFLMGGTAVGASLLLGQTAGAESFGVVDGPLLTEYDIATNGISLHVTEQGEGPESTRRNGLSIDRIASAPFPYGMVAAPVGDAVAWIYNERGARNVWVAEPSSSGACQARSVTAYTGDDGIDIADLRWSGDGRWLVYTRGGDSGGRDAVNPLSLPAGPKAGAIWAAPLDGGEPQRLGAGYASAPRPKGDAVVFLDGGQPFIAAIDGGEAAPLFRDRGQVSGLSWSPGGEQ